MKTQRVIASDGRDRLRLRLHKHNADKRFAESMENFV